MTTVAHAVAAAYNAAWGGRGCTLLQALLQSVVEEETGSGRSRRRRAEIFMQLPTVEEYPEYYEQIGRPMDLRQIGARIELGLYGSVTAMAADITAGITVLSSPRIPMHHVRSVPAARHIFPIRCGSYIEALYIQLSIRYSTDQSLKSSCRASALGTALACCAVPLFALSYLHSFVLPELIHRFLGCPPIGCLHQLPIDDFQSACRRTPWGASRRPS